jgi:branched-subunit amino acid ABC-type transport system permease component
MRQYLALALSGIPLGAMYALQASGIVLVYKTSGVFNFAQGAIGMMAAYVASSLGVSLGLPLPVAIVGALVVGAVIGVTMEALTVRPVKGQLQKTVVTLGWLLGLQGLAQLIYGTDAAQPILSVFPATPALSIGPLFLTYSWDQLGVMLVTAVVAVVLGIYFKISSFGVAMRAVSDAPEGAGLLGLNTAMVTIVSWALGGGLAALSGVLVTPLLAKLDSLGLIIFTIQALAAALVGRLTSLPWTFAGGIALGMTQPVLAKLLNLGPGSNELIALLFVLGALLTRKRVGRGDSGGGGLAPVPLNPMPAGRWATATVVVIGVVAAAQLLFLPPGTFSRSMAVMFIWGIGVLSIVLLSGVAGQVSLSQAAFMGVGGFGAGIAVEWGLTFVPAVLIGGLFATLAAVLVGLPALRLRGLELAIATLSLSFAADRYFFSSFKPLVSPESARPLPRPGFADQTVAVTTADGVINITNWRPYALLAFVFFVVIAFAVASVRRGRTGAAFTALRSSEAATSAMGFSVIGVKLRGFALSGFIAGIGGALYGGLNESAGRLAFGFDRSITLLAYAVIAGLGSVPGAIIGGAIVMLSALSFGGAEGEVASGSGDLVTVLTAVVLILVLILAPRGLTGVAADLRDKVWRRASPAPAPDDPAADDAAPVVLDLDEITETKPVLVGGEVD